MSVRTPITLPSGNSPERAAAKVAIWRLASIAFAHPSQEFHAALSEGKFHAAFSDAWSGVTGQDWPQTRVLANFADFESGYIEAFLHGRNGKPVAPLLAGDYEHLLAGHARAVFMLNIANFYRHFGLQAAVADEGYTDEPDHLVSMLEFMAVLTHLEARALANNKDPSSGRRAQRDFLRRHMASLLHAIDNNLRRAPVAGLDATLTNLITTLAGWAEAQAGELEIRVGPYFDPDNPSRSSEMKQRSSRDGRRSLDQNLWG